MVFAGIFSFLVAWISEALRGLVHGWLLFGSGTDVFLAIFDMAVTAAVLYFVLKLMSDSRAWQLLKGILFIVALLIACKLLGLSTINYILSNSLSLLAIGFVVLFQPELRRALETVGRKSIGFIHFLRPNEIFSQHSKQQDMDLKLQKEIEALVTACERMAAVKTGALIIIERNTKLGELVQGTAIIVDAAITSTFIEQIFYKGSPLHDGAVLIRGGRIYAARCHVPLSDTYHMRRDYGTRHRAAVGASELGDAVVLVVSEERGHISLAVGGRLYPMENGDSLRVTLGRLLLEEGQTIEQGGLRRSLQRILGKKPETSIDGVVLPTVKAGRQRRQKFFLQLTSVFLSICLWAYVQTNINPIVSVNLNRVNIQLEGLVQLEELGLTYSLAEEQSATNLQFAVRQHNAERINYESVEVEARIGDLDLQRIREQLEKQKQVSVSMDLAVRVRGLGQGAYDLRSREPSQLLILLRKSE